MALLNKKLYIRDKNNNIVKCNIYSSKEETSNKYIPVKVDGVTRYIGIASEDNAFASPLKVKVKKDSNTYAVVTQAKPPYTEEFWSEPGSYEWKAPWGVAMVRVALVGGGGGGAVVSGATYNVRGASGETSSFDTLANATGGTGAYHYRSSSSYNCNCNCSRYNCYDSGGYSNCTQTYQCNCNCSAITTYSGGGNHGTTGNPNGLGATTNGFAKSFDLESVADGYGAGGCYSTYIGGSGGYYSGYVSVTPGETYTITVGAGGAYSGKAGYVFIAYGGDI